LCACASWAKRIALSSDVGYGAVQAEMARRVTDLQKNMKEMNAELALLNLVAKEVAIEVDR
jgi:hypothetical protein